MKTYFKLLALGLLTHAGIDVNAQTSKPSTFGKVILENENVKVYEYNSQPGKDVCGIGKHSHPEHLTVLLTEANITVTTPDGKTVTQKMPAGTSFWSAAETHVIVNSGNHPINCQIIEIKKKSN